MSVLLIFFMDGIKTLQEANKSFGFAMSRDEITICMIFTQKQLETLQMLS